MRKRIGIFCSEPGAEYQRYMIKAIFAEGKRLGYDIFSLNSYGGYGDNVLYAEGEKGVMYLPDLDLFEGIIVAEDTFDIESMEDELARLLKRKAKCPVIYLRRRREEFYSVVVSCRNQMADMTRHFIQHHGFTDLCFMQGKMNTQDAQERYQGFLDAMEEAGLPVTEHMVFEGDYWREKGKEAVDWFMEGRKTYPQAIICSNDYMALSVCEELKTRGIRVPEDVCISGYDNTVEARRNFPSITSVWVHFDQLGIRAVQMIDRIARGIPQEKTEIVDSEIMLYQSCGCGEQVQVDDWAIILDKIYRQEINTKKLIFMAIECQDAYDEAECYRMIEKYFPDTNALKGYLCMYNNDEIIEGDEEESSFPEHVVLKRIFEPGVSTIVCEDVFERRYLLPPKVLEEGEPEGYLILTIHYKNRHFGYIVLCYEEDQWTDGYTQAYLSTIANVIDAAEIHTKLTGLEEIKNLYLKDALTGIYNRRGFEKELRQMYEQMDTDQSDYLSVVSIDMDGLKYINDTYGHAEGDAALCILADVLKGFMKENEVCARVGGDEFSALLLSDDKTRSDTFSDEFTQALKEASQTANKPYCLQASVGICCITEERDLSLMACLQKADREMYIWKKKSKAARK